MRRARWLSFGFLAVFLVWGAAQAQQINFKADLAPAPGVALTDAQIAQLEAGKWYVNIPHRGQ